jgi:energy-coupling factor transport system ATP-binding protein
VTAEAIAGAAPTGGGAASPLVEVEGLTFRYRRGTEPAIHDVSLTVRPGEVVLVAGPSGCGKSTLIRAINGLIPHAYPGDLSGSIRVAGESTADLKLRDIARTVGTVLQDPAKQIVGATVEAELAFGPENLGIPREEIRATLREVAARTGIEPLVGRETSALSGGERQLVAVAGILMMRPHLLVVDEPLANLDPATASRLLSILRDLADAGEAVVIVEHRVEEALELRPDAVLYLEEGRTRYLGPVDGFLRIADPRSVKLPFDVVLERVRSTGVADDAPAPTATSTDPASPVDDDDEPPRLEFRAVDASIGDHPVLHGVDAGLGRKEVVAVLGPNGSGKTTLFRTAMRLLPITAGTILVDGSDIASRTTADLATIFGYVFQSPSQMLFARTVREELVFGPRNLGHDPAGFDALIDDVLQRASLDDIEDIRDRPPLALSFGQQKRLALAIALALRPSTLILDEPSSGQDLRTAEAFIREVLAIPGLESVYLITHDVDLALTHADRILLFRDGRIVADGPPQDVITDTDRWIGCNLRPTSLMRANARWGDREQGFLDAGSLARRVVSRERGGDPGVEGGTSPDLAGLVEWNSYVEGS